MPGDAAEGGLALYRERDEHRNGCLPRHMPEEPAAMTAVTGPPLAIMDCGGCYGIFAVELQALPAGREAAWRCARCAGIERCEQAARPVLPNRCCVHVDYRQGPFSKLVILAVNGDYIDVSVLGHPGRPDWDGRTRYHRSELLMCTW